MIRQLTIRNRDAHVLSFSYVSFDFLKAVWNCTLYYGEFPPLQSPGQKTVQKYDQKYGQTLRPDTQSYFRPKLGPTHLRKA